MTAVQTLAPMAKDLGGGFMVRRLLPQADRRSVGPFVFFDHFGPMAVEPGANHDVRPHPHIGLATLTYLSTRDSSVGGPGCGACGCGATGSRGGATRCTRSRCAARFWNWGPRNAGARMARPRPSPAPAESNATSPIANTAASATRRRRRVAACIGMSGKGMGRAHDRWHGTGAQDAILTRDATW